MRSRRGFSGVAAGLGCALLLVGCKKTIEPAPSVAAAPAPEPAPPPPAPPPVTEAPSEPPPAEPERRPAKQPFAEAAPLGSDSIKLDGKADEAAWKRAKPVTFLTDWAGSETKTTTSVQFLWAPDALYALWKLENAALSNTDLSKPKDKDRAKLYDEDVVEIFVGSAEGPKDNYYEIEVGPFGHFLDLEVFLSKDEWKTEWSSQLAVGTKRNKPKRTTTIELAMKAPEITALLKEGAELPLGLYRIEGKNADRQFLAWSPTKTEKPNFHVPDAFGTLILQAQGEPAQGVSKAGTAADGKNRGAGTPSKSGAASNKALSSAASN